MTQPQTHQECVCPFHCDYCLNKLMEQQRQQEQAQYESELADLINDAPGG